MSIAHVFEAIIYEVARQIGAQVTAVHLPAATPNFCAAELLAADARFYVLCSDTDTWAFSRFFEPHTCRLEFEDMPEVAAVLEIAFGKRPMSRAELEAPFHRQPGLSEADIAYWKPRTQGEALFNWWD